MAQGTGTLSQPAFRIRTISYFIPDLPENEAGWQAAVAKAAALLQQAQRAYEGAGYEVQTVRIVTRALGACVTPAQAVATAVLLERLCLAAGVTFLSLGASASSILLAPGCLSALLAATRHTSCSFAWQQGMTPEHAFQLAEAIHEVAEATQGAGNFRFGVALNCPPGIPFFPVACAPAAQSGFAIGTENSGLLFQAFQAAAAEAGAAGSPGCILEAAQRALRAALQQALSPVEALARQLAASSGVPYQGLDASLAPALEPPTITQAYELLGLGRFGGSGTLAVSDRITAAIKSVPLQLCGYSGLMLPVCEDEGLAAAADSGRITVGGLLHYSAVCGCGLDTVPVPGTEAGQAPEQRQTLLRATTALLLDVAAMAFRLNKPLSVRLLPVPGAAPGDHTAFDSPYLINCKVLPLE